MTNISELSEFLTFLIFTASAQHSAVNFGQYEFYSFVPNRPLLLLKGIPHNVSHVDWGYIMRALPDKAQTQEIISTGAALSVTVKGATLIELEREVVYKTQYRKLLEKLKEATKIMESRKEDFQGIAYLYLTLDRISPSISV
jgi:arachidonate 5-lipoxygenase